MIEATTEIKALHAWVTAVTADRPDRRLGAPGREGWLSEAPPFSFIYGGVGSRDLLAGWRQQVIDDGAGASARRLLWSDPATGLEVTWEARTYPDLPVVEWIIYFENRGAGDSPLLEAIQALDLTIATDHRELMVYHGTGGLASADAFAPHETNLERGMIPRYAQPGGPDSIRLSSIGGRPSNGSLPYFNVEANWEAHRGLAVAIGWSGQWQARISRLGAAPPPSIEPDLRIENAMVSRFRNANRLRLQAGMEDCSLVLHPGERIRSPRIILAPWETDRWRGQNSLRRYLYAHNAPKINGQAPLPPMAANVGIVDPAGALLGLGVKHLEAVARFASLGVEYFIVDAGWYEIPPPREPGGAATWSQGVGNYRVRSDVFPDGLKPLADEARRHGMKFGLWFEPERVMEGTEVFTSHADWLLPSPSARGSVLNFGNPEARRWVTDRISQMIEEIGIGWYRHDANANYLPAWRSNDPPNRRGMTEIRYLEGLHQFWQDLLDRHPGLYLEGCSSGGRRMDADSLRFHHSYFYTDWMVGDPAAMQSQVYGANSWLPGIYCNNVMAPPSAPIEDTGENRYALFSAVGGGILCGWRWLNDKRPIDWNLGRRWYDQFRALRHLAVGDFYPLLPYTLSEGHWLAAQFHRADLDEGMILAFRRRFNTTDRRLLQPQALDPAAIYEVRSSATNRHTKHPGADLLAGVTIQLDNAPAHEILRYRRIESGR